MYMLKNHISKLSILDKSDLLELLKRQSFVYKRKIGLPKDMSFGIEIEAIHPDLIDTMREVRNIRYYKKKGTPYSLYDKKKWILTDDESLIDGGELSTPIYSDNWRSWHDLERMMGTIKRKLPDVKVDDTCGSHIHFNGDIFSLDAEKLFSFMVLLAENEQVLTRFYNGEFINLREGACLYATSFAELFLENQPFNIKNYYALLEKLYKESKSGKNHKEQSFDFSRLYLYQEGQEVPNTIEIRIPNGTLKKEIIQNNVRITGKLLDCATKGNYDWERGLYNITNDNIYNNSINLDDALYVTSLLDNDLDKLLFLKQYYKDGSETYNIKLKRYGL